MLAGRLEAGSGYTVAEGEALLAFDDEGAFEALRADETLTEKREKRERRKTIGRKMAKSKWRRRIERVTLGVAVAAGAVMVFFYVQSTWKSREAGAADMVPAVEAANVEGETVRATMDLAVLFLESDNLEERAAMVRDGDRVVPLMREYYGHRQFGKEPYRRIIDQSETGGGWKYFDMTGYQYLLVEMEDFSVRVLVVEQTEEGPKLDWESWVIYGEAEWPDFRKEQSTSPVLMRPIVAAADYYNFAYSDAEKWACYRMSDPKLGDGLFGYVEKGSDIDLRLAGLIARKGSAWPVVSLRWPAEPKSDRQVEIVNIVSDRWVID
jgi:hypothetical protein